MIITTWFYKFITLKYKYTMPTNPDPKGKKKASDSEQSKQSEAQFASSSSSSSTELTEIDKLKNLQVSLTQNNSNLTRSIADIAINVDLTEIEESASIFIQEELTRRGFVTKIDEKNAKVKQLLSEIKFLGNDFGSGVWSVLGGAFSHEFSTADKNKWEEIERLLDEIYDANNGTIRKIQDFFLFQIRQEQILKFLNKKEISFEEELFIRSILIKGYLNNFRQLINPLNDITDDVLIKFKKERIKQLEEQPENVNNQAEIQLLRKQITDSESKIASEVEKKTATQSILKTIGDKITSYNTQVNTASAVFGTFETLRYATSAIGHKAGIDVLKKVGTLGFKAGGWIATCLPFVSAFVEVGTQFSNNWVVYNYEKKLKILTLIDNTKRNLLILEQQVVDYYIDNVLTRLQTILLEKQTQTQGIVAEWNKQQIVLQRDLQTASENIERRINFLNSTVSSLESEKEEKDKKIKDLTEREEGLKVEISSLLFLSGESKKKQKELEEKVEALNKILEEKDKELGTLTKKLDAKTLLKEKEKAELERELLFKLQNSAANKSQVIDNLQKELMDNQAYESQLESENLRLKAELRETQTKLEQTKRLKDQAEMFLRHEKSENQTIISQVIEYKKTEKKLEERIKELEKSLDEWGEANKKIALNNGIHILELDKKGRELNIVLKQKEDLETELEKKETTITQLNKEKDKLEKEKKQVINNSEREKKALNERISLITAEKAQLQKEINDNLATLNKALREKRWHFTNHETLNNAVNDANSLIRTYVPTTTNTFTATISAPFVWNI